MPKRLLTDAAWIAGSLVLLFAILIVGDWVWSQTTTTCVNFRPCNWRPGPEPSGGGWMGGLFLASIAVALLGWAWRTTSRTD